MGAKARSISAPKSGSVFDSIGKPFSYPELRSRIRALLRRSHARHVGRITRIGALRIHHAARQVSVGDTPVEVSGKEYALLAYLAADPTRVFTGDELLRDIWGFRLPARTRTVDSHVISSTNRGVVCVG